MTRRQGRYQRRQEKRKANLQARNDAVGTLDQIFTFNRGYKAGKKCCCGVGWKRSVQEFKLYLFSGTAERCNAIKQETWKPDKYVDFIINERGKRRLISAPRIQDRQIHKLVSQYVLYPLYKDSMIYNNGASLRGKGLAFSQGQTKKELVSHLKRYGRTGYVLLVDFSSYFLSVNQQEVLKRHEKYILNPQIRKLCNQIILSYPGGYGCPLGVEPSQQEMVAFPSSIDNWLKSGLGLKGAGHYMDDYLILCPPNISPEQVRDEMIQRAKNISLNISFRKTKIIPIGNSFIFCKTKYKIAENDRIIMQGYRKSFSKLCQKIPILASKNLSLEGLWGSLNGSLAYFKKTNNHNEYLKAQRKIYNQFGVNAEVYKEFKKQYEQIYNKQTL